MEIPAMDTNDILNRRQGLIAAGLGLGTVYGLDALWRLLEAEGAGCLLQRELTEGPIYLDLDLVRRNIKGTARARRCR